MSHDYLQLQWGQASVGKAPFQAEKADSLSVYIGQKTGNQTEAAACS